MKKLLLFVILCAILNSQTITMHTDTTWFCNDNACIPYVATLRYVADYTPENLVVDLPNVVRDSIIVKNEENNEYQEQFMVPMIAMGAATTAAIIILSTQIRSLRKSIIDSDTY